MRTKLFGVALATVLLSGCGVGSPSTSSTKTDKGTIESIEQLSQYGSVDGSVDGSVNGSMDGVWTLDDGKLSSAFVIIDNNKVFATQNDDFFTYGSISNSGNTVNAHLHLRKDSKIEDVSYTNVMGGVYVRIENGKYVDGALAPFGTQRKMDDILGDWFATDNAKVHYPTTIKNNGEFYDLENPVTQCITSGSVNYKGSGVYVVNGNSVGCMDSDLNGVIHGYMMVPMTVYITHTIARMVIIHDKAKIDTDKYQTIELHGINDVEAYGIN